MSKKKAKKKQTARSAWRPSRAVCLLGAACAAALILLVVVAIAPWEKAEVQQGEFVPPPFEEAADSGRPQVEEDLGWSQLAIRAGYTVWVCGELQAEPDGTLPLWLYSEPENTVWVKVRVLDEQGRRIGETGLLRPGEYVEKVSLSEEAASGKVVLHLMGYEPNTYYSAGAVDFETYLRIDR